VGRRSLLVFLVDKNVVCSGFIVNVVYARLRDSKSGARKITPESRKDGGTGIRKIDVLKLNTLKNTES